MKDLYQTLVEEAKRLGRPDVSSFYVLLRPYLEILQDYNAELTEKQKAAIIITLYHKAMSARLRAHDEPISKISDYFHLITSRILETGAIHSPDEIDLYFISSDEFQKIMKNNYLTHILNRIDLPVPSYSPIYPTTQQGELNLEYLIAELEEENITLNFKGERQC